MEPSVPQSPGEPLAPIAIIVGALIGVLALLTAFGLELSKEQLAAILGIPAALGPLVVWLVGRLKVTPTANVAVVRDKAGELVASSAAPLPNGEPVVIRLNGGSAPGGVL